MKRWQPGQVRVIKTYESREQSGYKYKLAVLNMVIPRPIVHEAEDGSGFRVELFATVEVGDENSYRLRNSPGENQRQHILQEGKPGDLTVCGDLYSVLHGTLTPGGESASLIIMQFRFMGSQSRARRFRDASVRVKFANADHPLGTQLDPEVKEIAPEGQFEMAQETTQEVSTAISAGISVPVVQGILDLNAGLERTTTVTQIGRVRGSGHKWMEGKRYGKKNTAIWKLSEDNIGKTGTPSLLRTALLVVPQTEDGFRAIVEIEAHADLRYAAVAKLHRLLGSSIVDPVYFSQCRENYGPQVEGVDASNLSACVLAELGLIQAS